MKEYRNIIIVGEKTNFVSMTFPNIYSPIRWAKYSNLKSAGQNNTNTINGLSIINRYMAEIYNHKKKTGESGNHYFAVPNNISKSIKAGTYKSWIKTGKTASGKQLEKEELYQWIIFASLYKELFNDVDFKPLSYYAMKNVKYNIKQMEFTKDLINRAHKYLEKNKEKNLFDDIADLL